MKKWLIVITILLCSILGANMLFAAANTWTRKADFGGAARMASGFSIGSKGYVGVGYDGSFYKDFWEYDSVTNVWTRKADFVGTARGVDATSIGSKGYIGAGIGSSETYFKDFWEYDPTVNMWIQKADFGGIARDSIVSFSIGNKGYMGTGWNGSVLLKDFWEYDPDTNIWTQKADFGGTARGNAVGFSIGSKGYVGTGYDGTSVDNPSTKKRKDFWEYDPTANAWTRKADFGGTERKAATAFSIGNKGYLGTGYNGGNYFNDFWEYDPAVNAWIRKTDLGGSSRSNAAGFTIGSKGYIGAGYDGTLYLKDFWEYNPYTWIYSNSVGSRNSIKITDMSGTLSFSGSTITVNAWDSNGNALTESSYAASLTLYSNGTTTISGADLIARFPYGTPILYAISADSSKYIITNVMISADGTLNIPNGYASDTTKFITNSVGGRNAIKITDMSGTLSASGAAITVTAWDANGVALTESSSATPLILYNHGTTTISGPDLQARFPSAIPMSYEFTVASSKYVIVNVKSSADGSINIPYAFTSGSTKFVANSIGSRNNIRITDMSGTLSATGAAITVSAWDVNGNALAESGSAAPLLLYSHGTTTISGTNLMARFPSAIPMAYEFTVNSTKYLITNTKSSTDGTITIPFVYTSGTSNYVINSVSNRNTLKITDVSALLSSTGAAITVSAWDVNGNALAESGSAAALKLYNNGTTTITGSDLMARFPTGTPVSYEFTIGSTQYDITNLVANTDGTINVPSVYSSGVAGGI